MNDDHYMRERLDRPLSSYSFEKLRASAAALTPSLEIANGAAFALDANALTKNEKPAATRPCFIFILMFSWFGVRLTTLTTNCRSKTMMKSQRYLADIAEFLLTKT